MGGHRQGGQEVEVERFVAVGVAQQAAQQLGYALNQRAQVLRRGSSKTLAVVLPSLYNRCYVDFFTSFRNYAQNCGYQVSLLLTDDQPEKEERAIGEIQSGMMAGTAAFTCLHDDGAAYAAAGVQHICCVERSPGSGPSDIFCIVDTRGSTNIDRASYSSGVSPCFKV